MDIIGDPGFVYHKTMAQLWALLILELADRELLPFDFMVYAEAVRGYVGDLQTYAKAKGPKDGLNLTSLYQAADDFTKNAAEFHAWNKVWEDAIGQGYETSMFGGQIPCSRQNAMSSDVPHCKHLLRLETPWKNANDNLD